MGGFEGSDLLHGRGDVAEERLDVIAVGAHPDDVEIACGGTLARLAQLGYLVGIVDLTDGEPTPNSPGPDARMAEAAQAAETLGIHKRILLDLPNRRLFDSFDARVALAKEFRRFRPRLVLGFGDKTPLASPDHYQAMLITDAAVFYSRLTKWDDHFEQLPAHIVCAQLYYSLAFGSLEMPSGGGHFVADISGTLETKLAAVRCYETQFPPAKQGVFGRIRAVAEHHGQAAGFAAGELFTATKTLGTGNAMEFVLGAAGKPLPM